MNNNYFEEYIQALKELSRKADTLIATQERVNKLLQERIAELKQEIEKLHG